MGTRPCKGPHHDWLFWKGYHETRYKAMSDPCDEHEYIPSYRHILPDDDPCDHWDIGEL